ncbi:major facilitator transporter [[Actinobacillus] muris]|uniref:Major facilitator transporter n=1 Tax=Muribacter muris TaxID=67855 RepID=A0A0J5P9A5_9PAST|nr:glycoside-pentoside-hexuronide (GPH):cation symporter [Muribacter muris]KMK52124.1 major facilitator transporter [[Actinobacillus] muris] [Muribacter muris]
MNIRPFGLKDKVAYMAGDIANDFSFIMSSSFLMLFYTNVLEIEGYVVGLLFLIARVLDAFTDVGMGRLVDTIMPFKEGRFRGIIKRAAPFVCVSGFLLFLHIVKDWAYPYKLAYVVVTYLLWGSFAYTAVNIPYGSMATVISTKPEDRATLSVFRTMGANIAVLFISFFVPLLIYKEIDGKQVIVPEMFTVIMGIFMVIAFFLYQYCWKNTIERVQLPVQQRRNHHQERCFDDIKAIFTSLLGNKALMIFILVAIILLLANLLIGTMNPYLYVDYFNSKFALSVGGMLPVIATFAIAPFAQVLVKKFGKKESAAVALLFTGIVYLILFFLKISNVWVYLAIALFALLGLNYFMVVIWAFITDIIDHQYLKTHRREDGTIYAVYSFARKVGQALAGGLGGFALSFIGYMANAPMQTPETLNAIYRVATLVPALSCIVIFFILQFWYPLSKEIVDRNVAALEKANRS